jgi:hypothetical protein
VATHHKIGGKNKSARQQKKILFWVGLLYYQVEIAINRSINEICILKLSPENMGSSSSPSKSLAKFGYK